MDARFGAELYRSGYRIYTTLDPDLQRIAAEAVQIGLKKVDEQIEKLRTRRVRVGTGRNAKVETTVREGPDAPAGQRIVQFSGHGQMADIQIAEYAGLLRTPTAALQVHLSWDPDAARAAGDTDEARRKLNEDVEQMKFAALVSVLFIYLLMAFLFESFILPLSIIVTIPLAGIGVMLAHALAGHGAAPDGCEPEDGKS